MPATERLGDLPILGIQKEEEDVEEEEEEEDEEESGGGGYAWGA